MDAFKEKTWWLLGLLIFLVFLYVAQEALVVVFTAFIFASALLPLVEHLDEKMPRWLAVLIPYAVLLIFAIGIVMPTLTIALQHLQSFVSDLPKFLDQLKDWLSQWDFLSRRYAFLAGLKSDLLLRQISLQNALVFSGFTGMTLALTVSRVGVDILSALVISIFLLLDRERIQNYVLRFWPSKEHAHLTTLLENLIRSTGAFVNGQLLFMTSFGVFIAVGLYLIGLPFPVLLGLLAGTLSIIPILGPNIALVPTLIIALLMPGGWVAAIWVFVLFVMVQVVENNIIGPLIMGRAVGLHPLAILLAILFGGIMFGMVGVILAIPVVACLKIILNEWFLDPEHRLERLIRANPPLPES